MGVGLSEAAKTLKQERISLYWKKDVRITKMGLDKLGMPVTHLSGDGPQEGKHIILN